MSCIANPTGHTETLINDVSVAVKTVKDKDYKDEMKKIPENSDKSLTLFSSMQELLEAISSKSSSTLPTAAHQFL